MFKINSHFFDITSKVLLTKFDQNSTTKSKVIHVRISIPNDVWVKSSKTKAIVRCHTKGVSNQVSSNLDFEIKSSSSSNSSTTMGKNKKVGTTFLAYKTGQ